MFFRFPILSVAISLSIATYASPLTFISHKNDHGSLDQFFLKQLVDIFDVKVFVESGTYDGGTTKLAAELFNKVHTIELFPKFVIEARKKFKDKGNIIVHEGSSADILPQILPELKNQNDSILFFLDAHFCGEGTAVDKEGPDVADGITAIRKEIDAIKQSNIENCIVIVDDIRGFGTRINDKEFIGCWAYPCVQDVCENLLEVNKNFNFYLLGDMLLAYDKTKYQVEVSEMVKACTISRLFDGKNYSQEEVIQAENYISNCQGEEREFMDKLCKSMIVWKDPEFHHDLWYGLLRLSEKKYTEATKHLNKVIDRSYIHPRIYEYINQAN